MYYENFMLRIHSKPDRNSQKRSAWRDEGCQIGMHEPQLCPKPRHFCKLDMATSRMAFLDLNLHVLQVATSNSNN